MRRSLAVVSTILVAMAVFGLAPAVQAAPLFTLVDGNSTASWDLTPGAQAGMYSWTVDGVQEDYQQWFWYRIGNTPEASYDTLPLTKSGVTDTNFDTLPDTLFVAYDSTDFSSTLTFLLTGGAKLSGTSDIAESIKIQNKTNAPLDFHFYQYTDLDLAATPNDDSVLFISNNVVQQTDGSGTTASESIVTPPADHHEAAAVPFTLLRLNDGVATTLNDVSAAGPGNVTWAYEWDLTIPALGTVLISKDKHIEGVVIPEPSTLLLAAMAAAALVVPVVRRRRRH